MIKKKPQMKNCPFCGKVFVDKGSGCCPDCTLKRLEEQRKIKEYLEEHPGARMQDVMKATGVSLNGVSSMVKTGALVKTQAPGTYPCKGCGKPIRKGKFCNACVASMKEARKKSAEEAKLAKEKREAEAEARARAEAENSGLRGLFGRLVGSGFKSEDKKDTKPILRTEKESKPESKPSPKKRPSYYSTVDRWGKK